MIVDIGFKTDTAARWATRNPILEEGRPGFEKDQRRLKIGDGTTAWNDLEYQNADPVLLQAMVDSVDAGVISVELARDEAVVARDEAVAAAASVGYVPGTESIMGVVRFATVAESGAGAIHDAAVTPLGLAGAIGTLAPASHTHDVADVNITGTPDGTKFLKDDGTWAVPPGTGGGGAETMTELTDVTLSAPASSQVLRYNGSAWVNATMVKGDVGLGNVDNTSDVNKPVSTATQTALNGKANTSHTHTIANTTGLQTALDAAKSAYVTVAFGQTGEAAPEDFGIPRRFPYPVVLDSIFDLDSTVGVTSGDVEAQLYYLDESDVEQTVFATPIKIIADGSTHGEHTIAGTPPTIPARKPVWARVLNATPGTEGGTGAIPSIAGIGAADQSGTTSGKTPLTPSVPSGQTGKFAMLDIATLSGLPTLPAGWTHCPGSPIQDGVPNTYLTRAWRILQAGDTVSITLPANTPGIAQVVAYDGVDLADPFDPDFADHLAGSTSFSSSVTVATDSTSVANVLITYLTSLRINASQATGVAVSGGATEAAETSTNRTGNPNLTMQLSTDPQAAIGPSDSSTWTATNGGAVNKWARHGVALKPSADTTINGFDITLTGTGKYVLP